MKNSKIRKKLIPNLIAPIAIELLALGAVAVAGNVIIGSKIQTDAQTSYQEWEDRQRAIEMIDAWCEANGIVPEELEPKGVNPSEFKD